MATTSEPQPRRQCHHCDFWQQLEANPSQGGCHRWAPHPTLVEELHPIVSWPVTDSDDWCGEFRDRALPRAPSP